MAVSLTLVQFQKAVNAYADSLTPYKQTAGDARPSTTINDDAMATRILETVSALIAAELGDPTKRRRMMADKTVDDFCSGGSARRARRAGRDRSNFRGRAISRRLA